MKKITLNLLLLVLGVIIYAQPTTITWQGKLLDDSGNAITQNNVAMTFAMFDASTGGTRLWPASGVVTKTIDIVQGLYTVQLGTGTGDDIAFTAAMFDGKTPWLEVKVGTETLPRTEITNVPFALISRDLSAAGWENPGELGKTTPNTGKFTSLETASVKITTGAVSGKVLTSDSAGNASWQNSRLINFEESNYTFDSKTGVLLKAANAGTDVDLVISPKGAGGIMVHQPDGNPAGGDHRGMHAVDLQLSRGHASQVAGGNFSVISGGYWNEASGNHASVGGGSQNLASGSYSSVPGGKSNTAEGYGASAFGVNNQARGANSMASGYSNSADGDYTFVAGSGNLASDFRETVFGSYAKVAYGSAANWNLTDRLFTIGNGTGASADLRSNALTILKNANTTIGGSLTLNGNGTNSSITLPTGRGTDGQFLKTKGDGTTAWSTTPEPGSEPGQMLYWNGTAWVNVAPGTQDQILRFRNGAPQWVDDDMIQNLSVGDYYRGGIIAYILQPGDPGYDPSVRHGIIAAPTDWGTGVQWGCFGTSIGGTGTALGSGAANTAAIVAGCSNTGIAARICSDLVLNGYDDWYLPSRDELNKLYLSKSLIGNFADMQYWSSSNTDGYYAWEQNFISGFMQENNKILYLYVRAVRSF